MSPLEWCRSGLRHAEEARQGDPKHLGQQALDGNGPESVSATAAPAAVCRRMGLAADVEKVSVQPDWLTYVTALGTLIAAVAAFAAVVFAAHESKRSRQDLLTERRLNFELGLLAEMSRQHAITGSQHLHGHLRALFHDHADASELSVARAATRVHATQQCLVRLREIEDSAPDRHTAHQAVDAVIGHEIEAAIERRMNKR